MTEPEPVSFPEPEIRREPIEGWPGYYAGDDGEIYSLHSGDFVALATWEGGRKRCRYLKVTLYRTRVRRIRGMGRVRDRVKSNFFVHNLVARAFLGRRRAGAQAAHKDGNRRDNRSINLVWKTKRQNEADKVKHGTAPNGQRNGQAKLHALEAVVIRSLRAPVKQVAEAFGISVSQVRRIRAGEAWCGASSAAPSHSQSSVDITEK